MIKNNMQWCALIISFSCFDIHLLHFESSDFVAEAFLLCNVGSLCNWGA
jgi:hypothetical protein